MINASEAREDDETFKNPVDVMFDELEARDPDHFAVKQYRKYKLAAGDATTDYISDYRLLRIWFGNRNTSKHYCFDWKEEIT